MRKAHQITDSSLRLVHSLDPEPSTINSVILRNSSATRLFDGHKNGKIITTLFGDQFLDYFAPYMNAPWKELKTTNLKIWNESFGNSKRPLVEPIINVTSRGLNDEPGS